MLTDYTGSTSRTKSTISTEDCISGLTGQLQQPPIWISSTALSRVAGGLHSTRMERTGSRQLETAEEWSFSYI